MRNPKIKVGSVFLLLLVMGFVPSLAKGANEVSLEPKVEAVKPKTERRPSPKLDKLFQASRIYLWAGTSLDMATTIRGLNHPPIARQANGVFLMSYPVRETGWAGHIVGSRNTGAVVALNVGLNLGVDFLSRKLYRKGGRLRYVAIALNLFKATGNTMDGVRNIGYMNNLDSRIRQVTGYSGQIVWTRH